MADRTSTGVPIALPTVRIQIDAAGAPTVTVDKEPYAVHPGFGRDHVRGLFQDLAGDLGPIRVEITESNGEKCIDIQTPGNYADASRPDARPSGGPRNPRSLRCR